VFSSAGSAVSAVTVKLNPQFKHRRVTVTLTPLAWPHQHAT
jgi:hypothetical protein